MQSLGRRNSLRREVLQSAELSLDTVRQVHLDYKEKKSKARKSSTVRHRVCKYHSVPTRPARLYCTVSRRSTYHVRIRNHVDRSIYLPNGMKVITWFWVRQS